MLLCPAKPACRQPDPAADTINCLHCTKKAHRPQNRRAPLGMAEVQQVCVGNCLSPGSPLTGLIRLGGNEKLSLFAGVCVCESVSLPDTRSRSVAESKNMVPAGPCSWSICRWSSHLKYVWSLQMSFLTNPFPQVPKHSQPVDPIVGWSR